MGRGSGSPRGHTVTHRHSAGPVVSKRSQDVPDTSCWENSSSPLRLSRRPHLPDPPRHGDTRKHPPARPEAGKPPRTAWDQDTGVRTVDLDTQSSLAPEPAPYSLYGLQQII